MTPFHTLAATLRDHSIKAEALTDAAGRVVAVRFYLGGRAFNLQPFTLEDGQLRIEVEPYEAEEPPTPEERLEHVVEVVKRSGLDG